MYFFNFFFISDDETDDDDDEVDDDDDWDDWVNEIKIKPVFWDIVYEELFPLFISCSTYYHKNSYWYYECMKYYFKIIKIIHFGLCFNFIVFSFKIKMKVTFYIC